MNATSPESQSAPIVFSVVVPFFNEEANVQPLLGEIAQALCGLSHCEIVAVDDCSTDRTLARLEQGLADCALPGILVRHAVNRGQSAALCSGIEAAHGEWVITLDGDGQNDPADIPALLRHALEPGAAPPPALICGYRQHRRDNLLRRLSSRVANGVRAWLLGDATPDTGCGLKIMRRAAFLRLPRFDHMHRFLPALMRRDGSTVLSVPVSHRPRLHGRSKYGVWNRLGVGIVDLCGVMWLKRRAFKQPGVEESRNDG